MSLNASLTRLPRPPRGPVPSAPLHPAHPALRAAVALALAGLSACSSLEEGNAADGVDYRAIGAKKVDLSVPPDLTQLARDPRYQAAGGSLSATQLQAGAAAAPVVDSAAIAVTPPASADLRLERAGSQRWISTTMTPEQVWPVLRAFWPDNGLAIETEQPEIGLIVTGWTENRANLPQDFIRRNIGKVFSNLYDTGLRDQYRARVQRADKGSEIVITHRGMEEVYVDSAQEQTRWQPRPNDPELEAVMLTRLMVRLGAKPEAAKTAVAATAPTATTGLRARAVPGQVNTLLVDDNFDRAWRRVGIALDRSGFTVEDRDRGQGTFFVRYADPKLAGKDQPGFLARLFTNAKEFEATARYRVTLKSNAEATTVAVLTEQGGEPSAAVAEPIVRLLVDELK